MKHLVRVYITLRVHTCYTHRATYQSTARTMKGCCEYGVWQLLMRLEFCDPLAVAFSDPLAVGFSDPLAVRTLPEMKPLQTDICESCTYKYALKSTANPMVT